MDVSIAGLPILPAGLAVLLVILLVVAGRRRRRRLPGGAHAARGQQPAVEPAPLEHGGLEGCLEALDVEALEAGGAVHAATDEVAEDGLLAEVVDIADLLDTGAIEPVMDEADEADDDTEWPQWSERCEWPELPGTGRARDDVASVQTLRTQVRVLEEELHVLRTAPARVDLGQLAVQAVGRRTSDTDDARHVVARVAALMSRLEQPDAMVRPVLPEPRVGAVLGASGLRPGPTVTTAVPLAPELDRASAGVEHPPVPAVEPTLVLPAVPTGSVAGPAEPQPSEQPEQLEQPEAEGVAEPREEVVLPVPPPAQPAPRRRGRLRRHPAA